MRPDTSDPEEYQKGSVNKYDYHTIEKVSDELHKSPLSIL
jgi:hypothetical protein